MLKDLTVSTHECELSMDVSKRMVASSEAQLRDETQQGIRVPMSIDAPREDFDKNKNPCMTIDVVINPNSVKKCNIDPSIRSVICNFLVAAIESKYNFKLDPNYTSPKLKSKGTFLAS